MVYNTAIRYANVVKNPMATALKQAYGTATLGLGTSSARCKAASRPEYIKHVVSRLAMKQTPSGQPVWLMNVVHTKCEGAFGEDRMSIAKNEPKKTEMQRKTTQCK